MKARVLSAGGWVVRVAVATALAVSPSRSLAAQALEDNSFLVEEAYNQPTRVVQHISTAELHHGATLFSFTQEWPLGGPAYQLSYTLRGTSDEGNTLGDALVNLRWQAAGTEGSRLFVAPRLSAVVPLGDADKLAGNGGTGLEAALPVSWAPASFVTFHGNLGLTWRPDGESALGTAATTEPFAGVSAVIFLTPKLNLIAESVWRNGQAVVGDGDTEGAWEQAIALGARAGFDLPGGVQVVPGVAWMPAIDATATRSFLYLSIEHGF